MFKAKLSLLKENISLMNTKSHRIKRDPADVESRELSPNNILDATNNQQGNGNMMTPRNSIPTQLLNSNVKGMTVSTYFEHDSNSSSTSQTSSVPLIEPLLEKQKYIERKETSSASDDGSTQSLDDETNENTPLSKLDSDCSSISEEISLHSLNSNMFNNSKIISFSNDNIHVFHPSNRTPQISVMAVDENVNKQSLDENSFTSKSSPKSHSFLPVTEYQSDFDSIISSTKNEKNRLPIFVQNIPRPSSLTDKIEDRSSTKSLQKRDVRLGQLKHSKRYTSDENNAYNHYTNSVGVQTEENFNLLKLRQYESDEMRKQAHKHKGVRNFNVSMQKSLWERQRYALERNRMRCPVVQPVDLIRSTEKSNLSRGRLNFSGGMLVEQALDEMLRQQIALTRHFIESHQKMYINYCKTVRDMNLDYRRF